VPVGWGRKKKLALICISFPYLLLCSLSSLLSCAVKWPQHEADILVFPNASAHNAWGFTCAFPVHLLGQVA